MKRSGPLGTLKWVALAGFLCFLTVGNPQAALAGLTAENSRSDSIDIIDYDIHLNIDYSGKTIAGWCAVSFRSRINDLGQLYLDLLKFKIDSVVSNGTHLLYTYDDSVTLKIELNSLLQEDDSANVNVYYHGSPQGDASGWGGWYWNGDLAFNLGVGFAADPPVYGRAWFPCFDNFVERSTFHFSITTPSDKMALCNGSLIYSEDHGNGTRTWNWELLETIPSYLACVAVNKYAPAYSEYESITGEKIPIQYGAVAGDTTKLKNSFIHLTDALEAYEKNFGAYRWNKVGYSITTVGAMEHATNIAYPGSLVNGLTTYEDIMAHELSHSWFGNLVTCRTADDMWLNEGWAVFCEFLFFEYVYGKEKYLDAVKANHEDMVHYAHTPLRDGAYYPVSGVPLPLTYGSTVYTKGADVAHTLRGYMGDSLFFHCIRAYLDSFAFRDASSEDFRDFLTGCSGMDLVPFFDNWVFAPGWAAFHIDSVEITEQPFSVYDVRVFVRQRLNHTPEYYRQVPLELTFYDAAWNTEVKSILVNSPCDVFSFQLNYKPAFIGLDLNEKISDAVTADLKVVNAPGSNNFVYGKMLLTGIAVTDSALVRVEHIFAAPDPIQNPPPALHISQERFWKVDGIWPTGFSAGAIINYNGTAASGGYLDNGLISTHEDSLVVLYRPSAFHHWLIENDVTQNYTGSPSDKKGSFTIHHLRKGEYALGIFDPAKVDSPSATPDSCLMVGLETDFPDNPIQLEVWPNPAFNEFTVTVPNLPFQSELIVTDMFGRTVYSSRINGAQKIVTANWNPGVYFVTLRQRPVRQASAVLVIQ